MHFLADLFTNKVFLAPASAWFIAQVLKIIISTVKSGFNVERLVGGGGMPSSHSAIVTALMLITAAIFGGGSFEFVMALFFCFIVIYDGRGVRYETQRQGKALNNLNDERQEEGKQPLDILKFNEKIGHTVPEIIAGIIIGIICAGVVYHLPL
jgi:acid phosphatase family membrane protein YuiD